MTDILVVGAGFTGVCAAVTAARRGARVTLIEKESVPGGTSAGLHQQFLCGLFPNSVSFPRKYLNRGLTEEFCAHLSRGVPPFRMGKVWLLPYDPRRLVMVLVDLLIREKNIKVLCGSTITTCGCQHGRIESVRYYYRGKPYQSKATVFIDAGAGILLRKCGEAKLLDLAHRQMSGFALGIAGVTWEDALPIKVPYVLYQAVRRGDLPLYARWTAVSASEQKERVYLKLSLPAAASLSLAKKISVAIVKTLRQELSAFRSGKIGWHSREVFSRDGDRLRGQYILQDKDVLEGKKFSDGIMKGAWPMEFWDLKRGPTYKYPAEDYYELPARSIRAKNVSNLFAAGRCVSAEPGAQASLRAGGLCLSMGEAAGNAAVELLSRLRK